MQAEIEKDKLMTKQTLEEGLSGACADDITEALINLEDSTCDYTELIPVLEEIAKVDWFCYFDDNGAGGFPHADLGRRSSFRSWAFKAIGNIKENAQIESSGLAARVLKSNSTQLIKSMLERLQSENNCTDKSLIPILEKIARKDVYKSYSYHTGFQTDCKLGELALSVVQQILHHSASLDKEDLAVSDQGKYTGRCAVCGSLPDDITANTGRDEYLPDAYRQLIGMDSDYKAELRCCPACRTYFNWIDMPQMYGSGNCDEERLVRLTPMQSQVLDKLFTADSHYRPDQNEISDYITTVPIDLLLPALRFCLHRFPEVIALFVPQLVRLLGKNNDTSLWEFLNGYAYNQPERAEEILSVIRTGMENESNRLTQLIGHCRKVVKK